MKRIILSVFAAAAAAAWAIPAHSADISFSGQYRLRTEYRGNADFNENSQDQSFWDQRIRLTGNVQATDDTSFKLTIQDSRRWGASALAPNDSGPNLTGNNGSSAAVAGDPATNLHALDIHEGYLNINSLFGSPVNVRVGRQELSYGDERLIGSFNWSNFGRSFDAVKFMYTSDIVNVDLWESKVKAACAIPLLLNQPCGGDNNQDFMGVYGTVKAIPFNTLDLYVLWLRDGSSTPFTNITGVSAAGTSLGTQNLFTYGARLNGGIDSFDWTLELPFQTGNMKLTNGDFRISTWAAALKAGYTLPTPYKVRVGAEWDHASGQKDPTTKTITTFFDLFPTNHGKMGIMDEQAWRNVNAYNINASAQPTDNTSVFLSFWDLNLADKQGGWFSGIEWNQSSTSDITSVAGQARTDGLALRAADTTNTATHVGSEVDLVGTYKYSKVISLEGGYSHFFLGDYIKDRLATIGVKAKDIDYAYLMLTANF